MNKVHVTDGFQASDATYAAAVTYWKAFFERLGPAVARCRLRAAEPTSQGRYDISGGVLLTIVDNRSMRLLRFSLSDAQGGRYAIVHVVPVEFEGKNYAQLNIHTCPSNRIEGIIGFVALSWLSDECGRKLFERLLDRLLPNEIFEDNDCEDGEGQEDGASSSRV